MKIYRDFVNNVPLRRIIVLLLCIFVIWLMRDMMSTILLTFIFTFLSVGFIRRVQKHLPKAKPFWIITPLYVAIVALIYIFANYYIPGIFKSTVSLTREVVHFYNTTTLPRDPAIAFIISSFKNMNLDAQLKSGLSEIFKYITSIGAMGVTLVMSFILSYLYAFDVDQMDKFGRSFFQSKISWLFEDIRMYANKFINTFGVVLEAQVIIALINTALTSIALAILKIPSIPSLAIMVFVFSLVPVMGVIISLIPLSFIGFSVGGMKTMIYIWIVILAIHLLETYVLNPKLMSSKTHLPVFVTFIVLFISEFVFGTWGLIVGIPIFTFFLDILGVKEIGKNDPLKVDNETT